MFWTRLRPGNFVYIDDVVLALVSKDHDGMLIRYAGKTYKLERDKSLEFPTFSLHSRKHDGRLLIGIKAEPSVLIRREEQ